MFPYDISALKYKYLAMKLCDSGENKTFLEMKKIKKMIWKFGYNSSAPNRAHIKLFQ